MKLEKSENLVENLKNRISEVIDYNFWYHSDKENCCKKRSMKICNAFVQNMYAQNDKFTEKDAFVNNAIEIELVWIKRDTDSRFYEVLMNIYGLYIGI